MVLRVALGGQPVPLHGVGEDHRRPGVVDRPERLAERVEVVAAQVADRGAQGGVVERVDERAQVPVVVGGAVSRQAVPQLGVGAAQQPLVLGVGHLVDAGAQRVAAGPGEQLLQQVPVLDRQYLPTGGGEHPLQPGGAEDRDDPVQALPVQVDDPDHLAQLADHRVEHGLPAGALVQLGVAEERVLPPRPDLSELARVAAGQRTPDRRGRPDPDRARRVVDRVGVLRAARVALQAAERAQRGQVLRGQLAEQVVDRVQHRRGVRLDRHPVVAAQVPEPQLGHDRGHRRAGRLVAPDLEPRRVAADPVGVVHDRRREPEHAALDGGDDGGVAVRGAGAAIGDSLRDVPLSMASRRRR